MRIGTKTAIGLFRILCDGKWRSAEELMQRCGQRFAARLHELRSPQYGEWTTERARGCDIASVPVSQQQRNMYFYRICPAELKRRSGEAALLAAGQNIFAEKVAAEDAEKDLFDAPVRVDLTVSDVVFLYALVVNDSQLNDPEIKRRWDSYFPRCRVRLEEAMRSVTDSTLRPFDIFNDEDEE